MSMMYGVEAMYAEAARFAQTLAPRANGATIIALSGELGSGKTTFTQGVARSLGMTEPVTSPTFVIEKIYELPAEAGRGFTRLIHIDTYRLKSEAELSAIGWHEIITNPANLIFVEWPEQITGAIPEGVIELFFSGSGDWREVRIGKTAKAV